MNIHYHEHIHDFVEHIGIKVFGGQATAWIPVAKVDIVPGHGLKAPRMLKCLGCGEQGYEVRQVPGWGEA
jgi:hypothetical protein